MINTIRNDYFFDPIKREESMQFTGFVCFGPGEKVGHPRILNTIEELKAFCLEQRGDGTPIKRQQKNQSDKLFGRLGTLDPSVRNALLDDIKKLPLVMARVHIEKLASAMMNAMDDAFNATIAEHIKARYGAGGKHTLHPVDPFGFRTFHLCNNNGDLFPHVHEVTLTYVINRQGEPAKTYTVSDPRIHFRLENDYDKIYQERLAHYLKEYLKWEIELNAEGKAVVKGYQQVKKSERQKTIEAYLEDRGIESTPQSRAYAVYNTRKPLEKVWDVEERLKAWGCPHEQKPEQTQAPPTIEPTKTQAPDSPRDRGQSLGSAILGVYKAAWKATFSQGHQTFKVRDAAAFLYDIQKRPMIYGHLNAIKALRKSQPASLNEALKIAEVAYKAGRAPKIKLKKGDAVVVSAKAFQALAPDQQDQLESIVKKKRGILRIGQGPEQSQSQGR